MDVPYLRGVLIPFWVLQLIFIIISLGDSAYLLSVYSQGQTETGTCDDYYYGYYACSVTLPSPPILLAYGSQPLFLQSAALFPPPFLSPPPPPLITYVVAAPLPDQAR